MELVSSPCSEDFVSPDTHCLINLKERSLYSSHGRKDPVTYGSDSGIFLFISSVCRNFLSIRQYLNVENLYLGPNPSMIPEGMKVWALEKPLKTI